MASKQNYLPTWTTVTPVKPVEKKTTVTPILPPMVGSKLVAPVLPPVPVKLATPVTPPAVKKNETPVKPLGPTVVKTEATKPTAVTDNTDNLVNLNKRAYDTLDRMHTTGTPGARKRYDDSMDQLVQAFDFATPTVKRKYQEQVDTLRASGLGFQTDSEIRRQAARIVSDRIAQAKSLGFSNEIAPTVPGGAKTSLDYMFAGEIPNADKRATKRDTFAYLIGRMSKPQQETLATLADGWTGTFYELYKAAKSLSD